MRMSEYIKRNVVDKALLNPAKWFFLTLLLSLLLPVSNIFSLVEGLGYEFHTEFFLKWIEVWRHLVDTVVFSIAKYLFIIVEFIIKVDFSGPYRDIFTLLMLYSVAQSLDAIRKKENGKFANPRPIRALVIRLFGGMIGALLACVISSSKWLQYRLDDLPLLLLSVTFGLLVHRLFFSFQFALDKSETTADIDESGKAEIIPDNDIRQGRINRDEFVSQFKTKISPFTSFFIVAIILFSVSVAIFQCSELSNAEKGNYSVLFIGLLILMKSHFHLKMNAKWDYKNKIDSDEYFEHYFEFPFMRKGNERLAIDLRSGNWFVGYSLFLLVINAVIIGLGIDRFVAIFLG